MNIRGIELLRKLGLLGPKKEIISRDLSSIDLDELYAGAVRGATILAFDYTEPINQNPLLEKNVRKYKIEREDYYSVLDDLIEQLGMKCVSRRDMVFLTHQTYAPVDIKYSGRVAIYLGDNGFGSLLIDAVESLRKGSADFDSTFIYRCPINGGRVFRSRGEILKQRFDLPFGIVSKLIGTVYRLPCNPNVDFEVYNEGGLFYHDMFLAS